MKFKVFLDGGGTKTAVVVLDESNKAVAEAVGGPSNINAVKAKDLSQAAKLLWGDLQKLIVKTLPAKSGLKDVERLCFGLAGMGIGPCRQKDAFAAQLDASPMKGKYILRSDAEVAYLGTFGVGPGALVISGTGSVVICSRDGAQYFRAGGYGNHVGDLGSGYSIGIDCIQFLGDYFDAGGKARNSLAKKLSDTMGINSSDGLRAWCLERKGDHGEIAKLSRVCHDEALFSGSRGTDARRILDSAVEVLVKKVACAKKNAGIRKFSVAYVGGNFEGKYFEKRFAEVLQERIPQATAFGMVSAMQSGINILIGGEYWK